MDALRDALQSVDLGSSLCARFKRVCLDETECVVQRPYTVKTYVDKGMLETLENSSESRRRCEDLEFMRLSQIGNLFGFEDDGKSEASSADSYSVSPALI